MAPPRTRSPKPDLPALLSDILPIAQDDGPRPLSQIAYSDEYTEAMGYLRGLMAVNELSGRSLLVTKYVISMNPAHYTCWGFRLKAVMAVARQSGAGGREEVERLRMEIEYLNDVAVKHEKNYQIWHHRQMVMERIGEVVLGLDDDGGREGKMERDDTLVEEIVKGEQEFMGRMFGLDAKNYHVWSYRQWLVRRFTLFTHPTELFNINSLLESDIRNNSAWNHRFFIIFGNPSLPKPVPQDLFDRELEYTKSAIYIAPQNASAWNYLRGMFGRVGKALEELEEFALEFVEVKWEGDGEGKGKGAEGASFDDNKEGNQGRAEGVEEKEKQGEEVQQEEKEELVVSSHALDLLAEIWAARVFSTTSSKPKDTSSCYGKQAVKALKFLAEKYDPIRANYWEWRRRAVENALATVTAA